MVRSDLLLDESAVCDRILSSASDSITEASGLYVDGRFIGAVESRAALDGLLGGILDSHRDGSGTDQAQFLQDVKVVDGLYPLTSTISADAMPDPFDCADGRGKAICGGAGRFLQPDRPASTE